MLLNKNGLLQYLDFDAQQCLEYAREINPGIGVIQLSTKSGEGMDDWYDWLAKQCIQGLERAFA